ncbi:MAG: response regulator [Thermodesulfobacteriota bacterium]|nr:response regulator [Thermodesulfobacteriota bacterium]
MGSGTILIVDDDLGVLSTLSEILEMEGYSTIAQAANGLEGLEKYKELHPDLVLMDMDMPVMDGYESSREIKAFDPDANILVLTGNPTAIQAKKTLEEGYAVILLKKPVKWAELGRVIRSHCTIAA